MKSLPDPNQYCRCCVGVTQRSSLLLLVSDNQCISPDIFRSTISVIWATVSPPFETLTIQGISKSKNFNKMSRRNRSDLKFVWPKDVGHNRNGKTPRSTWSGFKDILSGKGPDMFIQRKGSRSPIKLDRWSNW